MISDFGKIKFLLREAAATITFLWRRVNATACSTFLVLRHNHNFTPTIAFPHPSRRLWPFGRTQRVANAKHFDTISAHLSRYRHAVIYRFSPISLIPSLSHVFRRLRSAHRCSNATGNESLFSSVVFWHRRRIIFHANTKYRVFVWTHSHQYFSLYCPTTCLLKRHISSPSCAIKAENDIVYWFV